MKINKPKILIMCLTGSILTLFLLPFMLVAWILSLVVFASALTIISLRYRSNAYLADGTDIAHGKESRNTLPVINAVSRLERNPGVQRIRRKILDMIQNTRNSNGQLRYKRMTETFANAYGYKVWKKCPFFNIEDHIIEMKLEDYESKLTRNESNGNCSQSSDDGYGWKEAVLNVLKCFGAKPFAKNRPLWEVYVFSEKNELCTVLFRFHHAVSDGIYILRIIHEDLATEPTYIFQNQRTVPFKYRFLKQLCTYTLLPFALWNLSTQNDRNPLHGKPLNGTKRHFMSTPISMEKLNEIKQNNFLQKTTVHEILISCLSFSISTHFSSRNCSVKEITALKPFPLQAKKSQIDLKNDFAVLNFKLALPPIQSDDEKTPIKNAYPALNRLKMVQKNIHKSYEDQSMWSTNFIVNNICYFFPTRLAESLLSVKGCTLAVSHLPGSKTMIKAFDSNIIDMVFWIPDREPMGVGYSIYSYNGFVRVGLAIDDALATQEEGELLMKNFESEVENLLSESREHNFISA